MLGAADISTPKKLIIVILSVLADPFMPFFLFLKSFNNMLTPYQSGSEAFSDLVQPFLGVFNLLSAAFKLIAAAIIFPIIALICAIAILPVSLILACAIYPISFIWPEYKAHGFVAIIYQRSKISSCSFPRRN